jgi:hypothetical protein
MTASCPAGHASEESDYCSVCGVAMGGRAPAVAVRTAGRKAQGVAPLAPACPVCGEPRADVDGRFCEVCRYDFVERTGGPPPVAAVPAPPRAPAKSSWELVLTVDASLDTEPDASAPAPGDPERVFPVEQAELLVGRRDDRQAIRPALALHDPGASRRHAKFLLGADGRVSLHDLGSTNGTRLNGKDVVAGSVSPLKEGDEVTLGRWTRIRLRARS